MAFRESAPSGAGGRRAVLAIGGLYLGIAITYPFLPIVDDGSLELWIVLGTLVGLPGLVLLTGGILLPRSSIRPEFYGTVATWCLRGIVTGLLIVAPILFASSDSNVVSNVLLLSALGSLAGFAAGVFNARAKTRRRELHETIERLEVSNERLQQFAHAASHDLQEPLRMVSSYLQILESRHSDDLDEEALEYVDFAVEGADRMRAMIEGILEYSSVERDGASFQTIDLDDVFADVRADLRMRIQRSGADVESEPLPRVEGDPDQLRLVFQNLLDNAIEYSGDEPPQIYVSAERDRDVLSISVHDEGVGIDPEYQERIFDVFETLHSRVEHSGTGIGLAICERIVERHSGDIWVDSEPEEGATFTFTLPAADIDIG